MNDTTKVNQEPSHPAHPMTVVTRSGKIEPVDVNRVVSVITGAAHGLTIDPMPIAISTISGLEDGVHTVQLDELAIRECGSRIAEDPEYSILAARLLHKLVAQEVSSLGVSSLGESLEYGLRLGKIDQRVCDIYQMAIQELEVLCQEPIDGFKLIGIDAIYTRYLLRDQSINKVYETPEYMFMRIALGVSETPDQAMLIYKRMARLEFLFGSPTLFNSGTTHSQMSSCYLRPLPDDSIEGLYKNLGEMAQLSKFAGGLGFPFSSVRSRGEIIKGTNGKSDGVANFLRVTDASVRAVNQGGRRQGAACAYLATWHPDIVEFLELRNQTNREGLLTVNTANWIPDIFMERVFQNGTWSMFDPTVAPKLLTTFGQAFTDAYLEYEAQGLAKKTISAQDLMKRMMISLSETGNGYMCFSDRSNTMSMQTMKPGNVISSSNLCTEILEVTPDGQTAVCNLGSLALHQFMNHDRTWFDPISLGEAVRDVVPFLDRVIDYNFYPVGGASASNHQWRPIGLGVMGWQDLLFELRIPFDSQMAKVLAGEIAECIYLNAIRASIDLAKDKGPFDRYEDSWQSKGKLAPDLWVGGGHKASGPEWDQVRSDMAKYGIRNSLLIAIAPTATIGQIADACEGIEPITSNIYKRKTLSGEHPQVNKYLAEDLKRLGLWTPEIRSRITERGSIQHIEEIPEEMRELYRTAWELSQRCLIELAAVRQPWIDQAQSLSFFVESPTIQSMTAMYYAAWKAGLKTTYYCRPRPATDSRGVGQATTGQGTLPPHTPGANPKYSPEEALACSLENPESCEACQ